MRIGGRMGRWEIDDVQNGMDGRRGGLGLELASHGCPFEAAADYRFGGRPLHGTWAGASLSTSKFFHEFQQICYNLAEIHHQH